MIYIQRFTSVHLKPKFDFVSINLYNLHLYLLIHLLYVLYSASICHAGISAVEKQFYYSVNNTKQTKIIVDDFAVHCSHKWSFYCMVVWLIC